MQKLAFIFFIIIINNWIYAINAESNIVGGFSAPIYFTHYDQKEIDSITSNSTAKTIKISYPHQLSKLAIQVANTIKNKSTAHVVLEELNLQDTNLVKYRHDVVVVVLFFNNKY